MEKKLDKEETGFAGIVAKVKKNKTSSIFLVFFVAVVVYGMFFYTQ